MFLFPEVYQGDMVVHEKETLGGSRKQVMAKEMATKVEDIKVEIDKLSEKIARRIEKLERQTGGEPVIMYRHDPVIREAISKIRGLYRKGEEICMRYHLGEKTCRIFRDEPAIVRRLELSEEDLVH